jgi:MFS family permease
MDEFRNFISGTRHDGASPPSLLKIRSSTSFILTTICLAVFTDIFLYSVIVPVIPFAIGARAGVPGSDVQRWVSVLLAVYGGALLVASPIAGWYADNSRSRRFPLLIGLLALAGATLILCLAQTVWLLVLGRMLQGISAAIVWTVGTALLVDTVGKRYIGQTMGYVSISMSLGILIAPLLGGLVCRLPLLLNLLSLKIKVFNKAGYFAVYYMAFGLISLDIILRLALIEKKVARQWVEPNQETANSLEEASNSADVIETNNNLDEISPEKEPGDPTNNGKSEELTQEVEETNPKMSKYPPVFTLLASRRLLAALWGCMIQGAEATALDSVLPLFVKGVFGWNSIGAGLIFLAIIVPTFLAPVTGAISDHYGPRWLTVIGFTIALPFWVCLRFVTENTIRHKVLLSALLVLIGASLTCILSPLMAEITYVVDAKEKKNPGTFGKTGAYAQAYGLFVMSYAAGALVGPLWGGLVNSTAGWGTTTWTLGLLSASGAVPALIWTGGLITKKNAKSADEREVGRPANTSRRDEGGATAV